nr:reverse transcriptase domain-containing protein [Tanacetum cinerariifolium]GFA81767.1 reverse transcriptase domain-containing protein [Tanacetum cinerariifolium]
MPPTMTTRSAGRPATASRGRGTGGRAGKGSGRTRGRSCDQGDDRMDGQCGHQLQNLLSTSVAQVGDQCRGQGNGRNQNDDAVNDNIRGDLSRGCTYKEFLIWDDLVNKFVNQFFPPSKTTHLKNEISRFTQRFEETFGEAWE